MSADPTNDSAGSAGEGTIDLLVEPKAKDLGAFAVRRALPSPRRQRVGPFIFFDHMGPARLGIGKGMDVRPHPHIGIATVTYLFAGEVLHRDSLGCEQLIRPGAVNWMTAGRGIVHSERSPESLMQVESPLHGIQTWLALPLELEETAPDFTHYPAESIPYIERNGASVRLIAGTAFGARSPVRTASETFYAAAELTTAAEIDVPAEVAERAVYVVSGEIDIGGASIGGGRMAVLRPGEPVRVRATSESLIVLFGGAPLPGDRTLWWNFVSSRPERIEQAKSDWREGRFDRVPGDSEFIPLPDE